MCFCLTSMPGQMGIGAGSPSRCSLWQASLAALEALLQPAWQVPRPLPPGTGSNDVLALVVARKRVSSGQAAGRGTEMGAGGPGTPFLIPQALYSEPSWEEGEEVYRVCSQIWRPGAE